MEKTQHHPTEHYIENLKKLDTKNRERLLNGNWEYDDDPTKIFDYDSIIDLFTSDAERDPTGYQTLQAVLGKPDMTVFFRTWRDYVLALRFR